MKQTIKVVCNVLLFTLLSLSAFAQKTDDDKIITGIVTDGSGMGVPGANVVEKGTKNGVATDFDGHYTIKVKNGAVLVFAYIGMVKVEKTVGNGTKLDVVMKEDATELEQVVVVGYGTQKKEHLTGAIATIKPDDIKELPVSNLSEALRGMVPGLTVTGGSGRPGEAASIQVRQTFGFSKDGNSTIPLVIIDDMVQIDPQNGKPTLETFNRLELSEIESITVLKDGSAAIYGARASQGAVIVKTKRGKIGKPKFSYSSQFAINDAVSHSKTMSAYEYGVWSNRFVAADGNTNSGADLFSQAELEEMKGLDYDWLKEAWKPAVQQRHSFNVTGGTEDITYFAGATYFTQEANLGNQDYNKWNFRTGMNAKISNSIDFSVSISGNTGNVEKSFTKSSANLNDSSYGSKTSGEQADYGYLLHMPKYIPWQTTVNGQEFYMSPFARTDRNLGSANANTTIAGWNYFAVLNNGSKQIDDDFSYNINTSLSYKVPYVKGLSFKGTFARTQYSSYTEQVQLPYDLARITNYEKANSHLASEATPTITPTGEYTLETNVRGSRVYYTNLDTKNTQVNFFANYDRTFGDHDVSGMFSVERSESSNTNTRLAYENTGKDYLGTGTTAGSLTTNSFANRGEAGTFSYLGRVNYSYKSKYLAQFLFRSDASTKFAPENYWGFFPSAQVGWVISKENWFKNVSWVDFLKLRYSFGKTGKDNVNYWRWVQYYDPILDKGFQFGTNGGTLGSGLTPRVTPNRDLRWDTTLKHNLGLDFTVLKNRLQVSTDFYYDQTTDMFTDMSSAVGVPISVGGGFAEENYADVDAWGAELSLNWSDNIKEKFSYNVGVNFGYGDNEVKKYPDQGLAPPSITTTTRREGSSEGFGPVWGFNTWKQTSTGDGILRTDEDVANYWNYLTQRAAAVGGTPKYMDVTTLAGMRKGMLAYEDVAGATLNPDGSLKGADGQITKEYDYVKLVKSSRVYAISTNLGMRYSNFYFKTQIATSWGGARFIDVVKQGTGSTHNMWAHESYWTDMYGYDNINGKYPNLAEYDSSIGAPSDFWQLNTFRCVVRNLTVGFDLPKQVLDPLKISKFSIGVTGNNLWDLYNPYPDHYRNMYDTSYEKYPTLRTWTLNLNIAF